MKKKNDFSFVDEGIRDAVIILNNHGFKTFESCQGGVGHCFPEPTIRFEGDEFDLIRAYEVCKCYNLNVYEVKRVYRKVDLYDKIISLGDVWDKPFNEIVFLIHSKTGTIFAAK